jgi:hypothetical protein
MSTRAMAFALDFAEEALKVGFDRHGAETWPHAPALVVFEFSPSVDYSGIKSYINRWKEAVNGTPFGHARVLVMVQGVRISFIDATGTTMATVGDL